MDGELMEEEAGQPPRIRARHIKKRALKNKALSVSFDEKDLKDYVTGFHKRKKKRRKEAQHKLEEAQRRKRIEERKKRKLEREFALYGGAEPAAGVEPDEFDEDHDEEDKSEPILTVSGTTMYDNGDVKVMVKTSEISREEDCLSERLLAEAPRSIGISEKKHNLSVSKRRGFKKVSKRRSQPKPQSKRDRKKGKKRSKKG